MELKLEFEELYISGTGDIELQSKTVVPTKIEQVIIADEDYTALSKVIIEAIPNEYQDVSVVTATADKVLQGYVFVCADGNTLQGEVPIIESAEVLLSRDTAEYTIPNGYHDGNGRVRIELEELTATPTKETQEITASENKLLSKVTVLPIPDDYVNKNEVPKPTLNAPAIYLNPNGGYVRIKDVDNGNFSKEYILYLNSEQATVFTTTKIKMQDYGITENDEIGVVAVSDMFNNSPMATTRWSDLELGTIGLTYSGNNWSGFGTSTDTEIYVASIVNEKVITGIVSQSLSGRGTEQLTVYLPDSIKAIGKWAFYAVKNKHFVFGAYVENLEEQAFVYCANCVFDLRNIDGVITAKTNAFASISSNVYFLVEDKWYDEYVSATNWSGIAGRIIKDSVWEDAV